MINLQQAIQMAQSYYADRSAVQLTKIYETEDMWIVFAGDSDQPRIGNAGISICKESGDISRFLLPSKRNFEILKNAKLISL